jgi:hypothetical protein
MSERMAASRPRAAKFATIADPPKLKKGVTTPVSGTMPSVPLAIRSTGTARKSASTVARKNA